MAINTPSNQTIEEMITLLKDPLFCNLRRLSNEHPLPWTEFCKIQTPAGLTPTQTWNILNALRRQTAIELPFHDGAGRSGWYYPTRSILADLDNISRRCHEGAWLDLAIKSRNTTYFLIEAHVDDTIAAVREDGLTVGYEKAREVLLGERQPETAVEQLLFNEHRALWDIETYVNIPCTPELIFKIYESVARGVGDQTTPSAVQKSTLWKSKQLDSTAALSLVTNIINQSRVDHAEHPLLLAMAVRHLFMSTHPLPAWNGVVSSLVTKLLLRKSLLPVLSFVPITSICREWEQGHLQPPAVMTSVQDAEVLVDGEVDYTIYVGVLAQLVRRKVNEIEEDLKRVIERDRTFSQALRNDLDINHRQRTVLQIALSNPEAVFRIEPHQKTHRVAYATARADLLKLANLGFLGCRRKKRAFEFPVAPGLRQLLTGHAEEGRKTNE